MNAQKLAAKLKAAGFNPIRVTEPDQLEDGAVFITEKLHVQVPLHENEPHIVRETYDGLFVFGEPRRVFEDLLSDIQTALLEVAQDHDPVKTTNPVAYFEAYACNDDGDGPDFAFIEVKPEFVARLQELEAIGGKHCLAELHVAVGPDHWGPGNVEEDLRFTNPVLVVAGDSFWFIDYPKHRSYSVETRPVIIAEFCEAVTNYKGAEPLFFGDNVNALKECVTACLDSTDSTEPTSN